MKNLLFFFIIISFINSFSVRSQSYSSIFTGINTTFIKNTDKYEYKPGVGLQFGYLWNIELKKDFGLLLGAGMKSISAYVSGKGEYAQFVNGDKRSLYYLSFPVGVNYRINKFIVFGGYRFGYNFLQGSPALAGSTYDHALFIGTGMVLGRFNLNIKYSGTVNNAYGYRYFADYAKPEEKLEKYNTLSLSVFYSFSHGKK